METIVDTNLKMHTCATITQVINIFSMHLCGTKLLIGSYVIELICNSLGRSSRQHLLSLTFDLSQQTEHCDCLRIRRKSKGTIKCFRVFQPWACFRIVTDTGKCRKYS